MPPTTARSKLFPALCTTAKIDCSKVEIVNMQPSLREQMLMQGQVDGVFGYVTTIRFSAKLIGVDPDKDLRFIKFGDYGMDLYSNAIIVSRKFVEGTPRGREGLPGSAQPRHQGYDGRSARPRSTRWPRASR